MSASARRNSGRDSGRKNKGGDWKKNPLFAVLAIVIIVGVWAWLLFGGNITSEQYVIPNMEFIFIPQNGPGEFKSDVDPTLVTLRYDNNKVPPIPFQHEGNWLWEAYTCLNENCPFLKQKGKAFIFPLYNDKMLEMAKNPPSSDSDIPYIDTPPAQCPFCARIPGQDSFQVDRYMTEDARRLQKEMTDRILRENP